jgi:endonuclease/exonuclease/phosphatase family metal-dependent hydrolase
MIMRLLNLLTVLVLASACSKKTSPSREDTSSHTTLRLMTYNIHHGVPVGGANTDVHLDAIASVINAQKPDLVALQEVDSMTTRAPVDEAKELARLTGMHYFFSRTLDYEGGKYGDAVLSRYPIVATQHYALPMPDPSGEARAVGIVTVQPPEGVEVDFAVTHLDLASNREAQVKALVNISKTSKNPLILGGDLNADPSSEYITTLKQAFQLACESGCPLTAPSDKPSKTIDYIVLNPAAAKLFHVVSYNVIKGIYASDHLPLIEYVTVQ